jgi:predicted neutral ceramidase superfamily lipid hydrolase
LERRAAFLLAVGAFAAHNAEEAFTVQYYLHQLDTLAPFPLDRLAGALTKTAFIAGTIVVTVVAALVAAWAIRGPRSPLACWSVLLFQSVVLLNTVPHVVAAIALRGYAPGLVTAVAVNAPLSLYLLVRAWRETWVERRAFAALAPAAVIVHGPGLGMLLGALRAFTGS